LREQRWQCRWVVGFAVAAAVLGRGAWMLWDIMQAASRCCMLLWRLRSCPCVRVLRFNAVLLTTPYPATPCCLCLVHTLQEYARFSRIVFDTAPTGHTLRLLTLPDFVDASLTKVRQLAAVRCIDMPLDLWGSFTYTHLPANCRTCFLGFVVPCFTPSCAAMITRGCYACSAQLLRLLLDTPFTECSAGMCCVAR
jgi:hypothetical protein